ncbi:tyrosine-type recombinase/integrase [Pseudomonas oryzihabitans]|uniref:tyrosine-type recombinase/integrase n=1 Tax=Pseudomonas oryzihabitans TaxID=47885 RepID=UPI00111D294B|nr:tyrosine-type recombinase/integrase [Pseudomonas psychrotolerans]QDD90363.1 integrase [Pseudomonas psychrotolerans]
MKSKITQSLAERAPVPERGRSTLYADTELRGFYLIVSPSKRAYYVQSLVNGRQVRTKLGDHPALDAKAARDLARKTLVSMRGGANPNEERRKARARGVTLGETLELHLSARALSAQTLKQYRYNCEQYLGDWMDRPLAELGADRAAIRERHAQMTARHGIATADGVMRVLRAVYNRGLREHPDLPSNPTANVDFHGVQRRRVDAAEDRLRAWGRAVVALDNPVRRDLHLFMILTGMRRTAACDAQIEQLLPTGDALHVPRPKGGAARAFDLPLSRPLQDLMEHRRQGASSPRRGHGWLFPADSRSGRVSEVKQAELDGLTGHALRHTYATLALEAGVPLAELKFLLNHAIGNVTMGYLNPSLGHLRSLQERASARVLEALGLTWTVGQWPPVPQD